MRVFSAPAGRNIRPVLSIVYRCAVAAGLLALSSPLVAQQTPESRPDFSGTWKMDASRSESAHQDVPIGPVTLLIQQTADKVRIETRRDQSKAAAKSVETLTFHLNGTESVNDGNSGVPVKAKVHWNGPQLVTETEREINGSTVTTLQVFALGSGGQEITI